MTELLTSAQMRAIEKSAIDSGAVTGLVLMERAGQAVVRAIQQAWPDHPQRAVVLCGPGNNGGDGYVIARLLAQQGWSVRVYALGPSRTADAGAMRQDWLALGPVATMDQLDWPVLADRPLVIDAMFGTGLIRDIAPGVWGALDMAVSSGCRIVAVDILSGLCADSGRVRAEAGYLDRGADLTVTFQAAKCGHHLAEAPALSGRLQVVSIGLEVELAALLREEGAALVDLVAGPSDVDKRGGHKFTHGHALVLSGPPGQGGAARLAARAALRIGAGLVTLGSPLAAMAEHAARLDALMLRPISDGPDLTTVLADPRITALCLGPGLGREARGAALLAAALVSQIGALVLDADALSLLAQDAALFAALPRRCVLTPHGGEFARLFPDLAARLAAPAGIGAAYSRPEAARAAAARAGCVLVLKGPDTVIAAPDGRCAIHSAQYDRAAPWLATAGAGDVLAGFVTGLLARGFPAFDAACTAVWLHVEAARSFGPGLIAEDLPEELPKVLRRLLT